ncbi:MAG: hypothetical protein E7572_05430 [Ruminococcaceae bacterium]|nr:hypothetical protein [Oscillospiraceae bacterium]
MKLDKSKLEIAMARKCIDPKALAEQAGICYPTLIRAAKDGKAKPSTIGKIADVLGVDVTEILKEV